ncbi:MAG: hypothetical protein ABW328_06250, partial [Ilumatobacteraceae bacterium]
PPAPASRRVARDDPTSTRDDDPTVSPSGGDLVAAATAGGTTTQPTLVIAVPPVAVGARPLPPAQPVVPVASDARPAWPSTRTAAGHVATDVGCADGTSARALDAFFAARIGPVIGLDYQHVYDLGGDRRLWLFQDTFLDPYATATSLDRASFAHNVAMVQRGSCFALLHRGTATAPTSFEPGAGERTLARWFWPLGGETAGGQLRIFWVEMTKTPDPQPPDGLGWVPAGTWLATYDAATLARVDFRPAPSSGVAPIYGYAVATDAEHTYLFGNTFDQNLAHQGGYHACPCSSTAMFLARVPRGQLDAVPEYRTSTGWSSDPTTATAIVDRFHAENPMQPRFLGGQWVAATKVDGYWGDDLVIDVADQPWGPWTTVSRRPLVPRGADPAMNTYHAYLMPWLADGGLVVSASQNARNMLRDAWPHPERYRPQFLSVPLPAPPADPGPSATVSSTTPVTADVSTTTEPPPTPEGTSTTTTAPTTTSTTSPPACPTPPSTATLADLTTTTAEATTVPVTDPCAAS